MIYLPFNIVAYRYTRLLCNFSWFKLTVYATTSRSVQDFSCIIQSRFYDLNIKNLYFINLFYLFTNTQIPTHTHTNASSGKEF